MILSFHPCITADRQVILGSRAPDRREAELAARAEAVVLPQTCPESLFRLCREGGAPCFPSYDLRFAYPGKVGQARLFRERRLPHPETCIWSPMDALVRTVRASGSLPHRLPFFIKTDSDHEGRGIRLVRSSEEVMSALDELARRKGRTCEGVVTQSLVHTEGGVLRAVILGRRVVTYWKWGASAVTPASVSRGARIDPSWRPDLQQMGRTLALEVHQDLGVDLAALDMVFDMTAPSPRPLVLEINHVFGRRGLGGSETYYRMLFEAVCEWLQEQGLDASRVGLV